MGRQTHLCEVLAHRLGCCSEVMTEGAGIACLTCALAEEFAGHMGSICEENKQVESAKGKLVMGAELKP